MGETHSRLRRFWTYLKPFKKAIGLLFGSILLTILINLPTPWLEKIIIDDAIPNRDFTKLFTLVALILGLLAVYRLMVFFRNYVSVSVKQKVLTNVRMHMYGHLQKMSLKFFARHQTGNLLSRITNDVGYVQNLMNDELFEVIASIIKVVVVVFLLFAISVKLTLLCLCVVPVITLVFFVFNKKVYAHSKALQESQARLSGKIQQNFAGMKLIQAEAIEDKIGEETLHASRELERIGIKREVFAHTGNLLTILFSYLPMLGIIWGVGGYMVIREAITLGELLAYTQYLFGIVMPITRFFQFNINLQTGYAALDRIYEIIDEKPDILDIEDARSIAPPIQRVIFDQVSLTFGINTLLNPNQALDHVSFQIDQGEKVAIVGPSGAGKTSIANLMLRFHQPTAGKILINNQPIESYTLKSLRKNIGYVSQEVFLFNDTVRQNVTLGRPTARHAPEEALRIAQARSFVAELEGDLEADIQEQGTNLSGGQRQRLALARVFTKDVSFYIFDEATSALDSHSEQLVFSELKQVLKDSTAMIIAHRFTFLELVDRILVFSDGRLVEQGTPEELLKRKGMFYTLYQSQQ
ncbi:MAG: ABC transporter ATP-binding protein [Pseudomonadota bacterium]